MNDIADDIIERVSPHTIQKITLVSKYVETWAQKLANCKTCKKIVFIDCMCNCGEYYDNERSKQAGTPVRVFNTLREIAGQYPKLQVELYFNDINEKKIAHLKSILNKKSPKTNFSYHLTAKNADEMLKNMDNILKENTHVLLFYDPYDANINWKVIEPFLNSWGEVILNHMVSDTIRGSTVATSEKATKKYQQTYGRSVEDLQSLHNKTDSLQQLVEKQLKELNHKHKSIFIASCPFFIKTNVRIYNLIHYTTNIKGFNLYKKVAWQVFGGKSSAKDTHEKEKQGKLNFENPHQIDFETDTSCYTLADVAAYIYNTFYSQNEVKWDEVWKELSKHQIFPADGFRPQIKAELKKMPNVKLKVDKILFNKKGGL